MGGARCGSGIREKIKVTTNAEGGQHQDDPPPISPAAGGRLVADASSGTARSAGAAAVSREKVRAVLSDIDRAPFALAAGNPHPITTDLGLSWQRRAPA